MSGLRIVFCGTPQFAVPSLKHLLSQNDFEIVAVITQPDRPKGRGQKIANTPVKEAAHAAGLAVHQPEKIREPGAESLLRRLKPDAIVIIAYGQIIPGRLLEIPQLGWINLHASLLPKYRGAAPINWAIANGEERTGVTTMKIDAGMDTGEMLLQHEVGIGPKETAPELSARLAEAGAPLMAETLRGLSAGAIHGRQQDNAEASYAPLLKKEDGRIAWDRTAQQIFDRMRGFAPWPGAFSTFREHSCHLWGEPVAGKETDAEPGTMILNQKELHLACGGRSVLRLERVKMEGRNEVQAMEFARGAHLAGGERFGEA
ncbi:MAG TPA: methionyl-tRNA formyltransferase [Candidatus Acidoferrum sp.]|nr:methionyl-tRNA formyltransferase [Candidatus Acidoferrum sp.]